MSSEKKAQLTVKNNTRKKEKASAVFYESVKMQYVCTKYCRCCPFPGLKCVENGRPYH